MTPEQFLARTERQGPCRVWRLKISTDGYGWASHEGRALSAHRLSWMLFRGPIPDGLYVCHTCDNRPCVEPLHLFLGTQGDNLRDARAKGRQAPTRLTPEQVREIRAACAAGESHRALGRRFGVAHQTITRIHLRQKWASLT